MTAKEIAQLCNVSTATVSNILNGKGKASPATVKKVMKVVNETQYKPNPVAKSLRTKVTKTVGIIAEDIAQFTTPDLLEGLMEVLEDAGYRTVVVNLRLYARWGDRWYDSEESVQSVLAPAIAELSSVQVDGIVYIAGHVRNIKGFSDRVDVPSVITHAYSDSDETTSVMLDDIAGGYEITKYLLDRGHTKIGFIGGQKDNAHTRRRLEGYQKALYEAKIPFNPDYLTYGDWERESGYKCMKKLIDKDITAVFAVSDRMAGGVYDVLEERGLVAGEDLSVVGYDDMVIANYFRPGLTTMQMPLNAMGRKTASCLVSKMEGDTELNGKKIFIPCTLIERKSVKDIR